MKYTTLFSFLCLMFVSFFNSQIQNEKIGVIFRFYGPLIINRQLIKEIPKNYQKDTEISKYYDAVLAMENDNINPTQRIVDFYMTALKDKNVETVLIEKPLIVASFPIFDNKGKFYKLDMRSIKNDYNLSKILIIECTYGFEFENIGLITGDKRTNIIISTSLVKTDDNSIIKSFIVQNIKNIPKKNLLNPPTYPNIEESMNKLLLERIFPDLQAKLQKL